MVNHCSQPAGRVKSSRMAGRGVRELQLLQWGPAPRFFPSQGAPGHAPGLSCVCRNSCEPFPQGTGPCEQLLGIATFRCRRISGFPQPFSCVQNFLWNLCHVWCPDQYRAHRRRRHTPAEWEDVRKGGERKVCGLFSNALTSLTPVRLRRRLSWVQPGINWRVCSVVQTLCEPMDCISPGSSVHGILQARILEWVAISFSRGSYPPKNQTHVSHTAGGFFTTEPARNPPALKWCSIWFLSCTGREELY